MPVSQPPPLVDAAVPARQRHPLQRLDIPRRQFDAVRHLLAAVGVVSAGAALRIEQLAVNPRRNDLAGVLVLKPHQTAQAAAIAQTLPLLAGHPFQSFGLPEGLFHRRLLAPRRPHVSHKASAQWSQRPLRPIWPPSTARPPRRPQSSPRVSRVRMAPRPPLVALKNVRLQDGQRPLFDGVDIAVEPRTRAALVGRNGAGKSTLMKMVMGLIEPDAGDRSVQAGTRFAYVPQEPVITGETLLDYA